MGGAQRLGLYGFGAAAHFICQVARHERRQLFAFTRRGRRRDDAGLRARARRRLGRFVSGARPELDAAISFAPAGELGGDELGRSPKGRIVGVDWQAGDDRRGVLMVDRDVVLDEVADLPAGRCVEHVE